MKDISCGLPTPSPEAEAAMQGIKKIAIVGASPKPERPSHQIALYLIENGYEIIPIRPGMTELFGLKVYPSLTDYGEPVDMVNIFRRSEAVPAIVDEAIEIGCQCIWMQEGVCHQEAADKAKANGMKVVQNKCILRVHQAMNHAG